MTTTDDETQFEIKRWGGQFLAAIDAVHEGESWDVAKHHLLGARDQSPEDLAYRMDMLLMVGSWIGGALLKRSNPNDGGAGFYALDIPDDAEECVRDAAQLITAGANGDDEHVSGLVLAHLGRDDHHVGGVLAALTHLAAPMWDRKPVDL